MRAAVRAALPRATVWPVLEHAAYLERLNACDMTLSPFPFGGLHSTIDSLSQGLPVVAMAGEQPHARTDATMLRIAGMPGWLCTQDAGAYAAAALRIGCIPSSFNPLIARRVKPRLNACTGCA